MPALSASCLPRCGYDHRIKSWSAPRFTKKILPSFAETKNETMPVYVTQTLLDSLALHTESFLKKAVSEWQMLPHHQFACKPAPEKWSANQCLAHLNEYGRYYLPLIETSINQAIQLKQDFPMEFKTGWLGNYFTGMMLNNTDGAPVKKMSAPRAYTPQANNDSYAVIAEFIEQQEKLLSLLRKAKRVDLEKIRIPVSIAKFFRLKLGDTLLFLIAHNYRHILQADRALEPTLKKQPQKLNLFLLSEMGEK
jgi:hypothetical protein